MEFVCYTDWQQLPGAAEQLFDEYVRESIFFSREWFENLTRTGLADEQSMLLAGVIDGEQVLALLALMKGNDWHLASLSHLYSPLFTLLLARDNQQQAIDCLAKGLDQIPIQSLRLSPVGADDANVQKLLLSLQRLGYENQRHFRFYNWVYRLQGQCYADYMASRPSRVRHTVARKQRKLQREQSYNIRLYTDQDVEKGLADYNTVYRQSWKAHEQFDDFVEHLAQTLSLSGWLRLGVLYIGQEPVAAQFWFVVHGKASIFKLVYDERWKHYSPGSILISYLMHYAIDIDKVDEIDFLTGNDAYKQDWMSQRRERYGYALYKPQRKPVGLTEWLVASLSKVTNSIFKVKHDE